MTKLIVCLLLFLSPVTMMQAQNSDHNTEVSKQLDVLNAIYKYLDLMYVDTLDASDMVSTGINAMLKSLDPYTVYYPEENASELKGMITGRWYAGIGAIIRYNYKLGCTVIDEPYEGNPAAEAGLRKGDIVLAVGDTSMVGKSVSYVSEHLRGDAGTNITVRIRRPVAKAADGSIEYDEFDAKITRANIQMATIPFYGLGPDSIGYLNLYSFTEDCAKEVRRAFIKMKNQGMRGFVLDLRGNGGGLLSEAVQIVNMFVPRDMVIVRTAGKVRRSNNEYKTTVEPIDTVMPIVVLVNSETASASEITAGSLQDLDRAIVLGTRTYGKGLVQTSVDLPYNGQLKLTSSKYYIPSGRCVQAINYGHDRGGYTEHIADSLTRVFHTANGREVRDGGGIKPDIEVRPDTMPNIAYYLTGIDSTEALYTYVTDYVVSHPTIAPAGEFSLTDEDYEEFKQVVVNSGFTYDPESAKKIDELKEMLRFEGYYDDAKETLDLLEQKLKHDIARDLDYHRHDIQRIIETDIVSVYYYQAGAIENGLRGDEQFAEACRLIINQGDYRRTLTPQPQDGNRQ